MCQFFSFVSNGKDFLYFNKKQREELEKKNPENYELDSHTSIMHSNKIKAKDEEKCNKYEYEITATGWELIKDTQNFKEDIKKVKKWLKTKQSEINELAEIYDLYNYYKYIIKDFDNPEILKKLSNDEDDDVRTAVAKNTNTRNQYSSSSDVYAGGTSLVFPIVVISLFFFFCYITNWFPLKVMWWLITGLVSIVWWILKVLFYLTFY
jgi:hypothetical protein